MQHQHTRENSDGQLFLHLRPPALLALEVLYGLRVHEVRQALPQRAGNVGLALLLFGEVQRDIYAWITAVSTRARPVRSRAAPRGCAPVKGSLLNDVHWQRRQVSVD